jgi:hypothetical protein
LLGERGRPRHLFRGSTPIVNGDVPSAETVIGNPAASLV